MIDKHPTSRLEELTANITTVRARIAAAAQRAGRNPAEITLVAVSKTKPLELVRMAYDLGITTFGENRVQEALGKIAEFHPSGIAWHMIGHVQSNKASKVVGAFDCIHSVDSLSLAQTLNRHAESAQLRQSILLQVNISGEKSKEGIAADEVVDTARQIVALPHLNVQGLMTIAPLVNNPEEARSFFRALHTVRARLRQDVGPCSWQHLSMGMTNDYTVAIEEGATIVRVGRAIFGERTSRGEAQ